jgi:hypothetical protein
MEICEQTFIDVVEHLTALNYAGPVGLSCDDTKLFSSMRLFWDAEKNAYFLIGGADGPRRVINPEEVRAVLSDPKLQKATKVRDGILHVGNQLLTIIVDSSMVFNNSNTQDDTVDRSSPSHPKQP